MFNEDLVDFIWDPAKEEKNILKHGIDFATAARAFVDPHRRVFKDIKHSHQEDRFFCIGKVDGKVLTVRFLWRGETTIRIIGAGYWRKGESYYDKKNIQN